MCSVVPKEQIKGEGILIWDRISLSFYRLVYLFCFFSNGSVFSTADIDKSYFCVFYFPGSGYLGLLGLRHEHDVFCTRCCMGGGFFLINQSME